MSSPIPQALWSAQIPLHITHPASPTTPFITMGLLVDLYQPALPWKLTVNDGVGWDIADTFLNCVKEADFIRNGNANQIMKMSKENTTQLWNSVIDNDHPSFNRINSHLLNAPTALKHVPIRIYVYPPADQTHQQHIQSTLRQALKEVLPGLFPSSRDPILAKVVMHGAGVPFDAPLEDLMREAAYPDGWLCLVVIVL
ncbi:hypothetical protein NXS19_003731 [Fusarium pseudograminearum]|nr:hypothetical protein NXS19_003731 [Fusarium pseudograminearum]